MAPIDLNLVRAFVSVHTTGSFSAAGARLGVPRSTVSRAVSALEESLGVLLFHRTTRTVTLTEAGAAMFERIAPSLSALEASLSDLPEGSEEPSGTLRVTTTVEIGATLLAEAIPRYTAQYPKVDVVLNLDNRIVDLVRGGFDLAVRVTAGVLPASSLMARKLGTASLRMYASPNYLARRGTPRSPADLRNHDLIALRGAPPMLPTARALRSRIACDDMLVARGLIRSAGGIGTLFSFLADADVASGRVVQVLPRWKSPTNNLYVVHPSRRHVPRKVTTFRNLLVTLMRGSSPA